MSTAEKGEGGAYFREDTVHILCAIINTGKNNQQIKFSPTKSGREIGDNFLLVKISSYVVIKLVGIIIVNLYISKRNIRP